MARGLLAHTMEWLGLDAGEASYDELDRFEDVSQPSEGDFVPQGRSSTGKHQAISCPIVRAEPRTMEEATAVGDEVKRQNPVVINLEGVEREEARRIRDFLGGVTYGVNGYMRKIGNWVYVCSPFDMPIEKLILDPSRRGEDRFEEDYVSVSELSDLQY